MPQKPELTPMQEKMFAAIDTHPDLDFDHRLVMYVIASHADDKGHTSPLSVKQIARETKLWMQRSLEAESKR